MLLGLPVIDAELALPESLLIAPVTWAGALLLVRIDPRRPRAASRRLPLWPFVVGALVAAGIAYQQTVVAEAAALRDRHRGEPADALARPRRLRRARSR